MPKHDSKIHLASTISCMANKMAITWKVCILELTIFYAIISGRHLEIHVCLFGLYLQIGNEHKAKQTIQKNFVQSVR